MKTISAIILCLFVSTSFARPNIVVVMVDDLDVAVWKSALDLGVLPNIKTRLIDQGTIFEQMFVSQPLCCPSRATFQTGQYPQNHGVVGNNGFYEQFKRTGEKKAIGTWLKQAHADGGYRTGFFGKYMNGSGEDPLHVPPGWDVWRAFVPVTTPQCMYGYTMANTGLPPETFGTSESDYQTDKLADLAVNFIRAADPRPYMLVVTPTAPHIEECMKNSTEPITLIRTAPRYLNQTPLVSLPSIQSYNETDMTDKPEWFRNRPALDASDLAYHTSLYNDKIASLRPVDDLVKKILDEISADTVVIFTSDNGFQYGTHRLKGKQDMYEESARVPMVIRHPRQTTPQVQNSWVMNNDWAPTIADYAEVTPLITVDGRSIRPFIERQTISPRQTMMIRTGHNPVLPARRRVHIQANEHIPYIAVRTRKAALTGDVSGATTLVFAQTYNFDGTLHAEELYDLATDPYQMESLHNSQEQARIDQMARLRTRLIEMKDCRGASCKRLENN